MNTYIPVTYTVLDMYICNLSVGHFECLLVEAVACFISGAPPSKIFIDVKREPLKCKVALLYLQ